MDKSKRTIANFMKNHPADYTVLIDTKKMSSSMYRVSGFPTTFMIDREGLVKHKFVGAREWSSRGIGDIIDKLIN